MPIGASISSSTSAVSAVLNSLTLMLYLLVPWTALNLVDYFFVRRGHYAITDIFLLSRSLDLAGKQSAIEASERELRTIDVAAQAAAGTGQPPSDAS